MRSAEVVKLRRVISGCVKSAAKAHGAITPELSGSAAKRIAGQLTSIYNFTPKHGTQKD